MKIVEYIPILLILVFNPSFPAGCSFDISPSSDASPCINLKQGINDVVSGSRYNLGFIEAGNQSEASFTILNRGTGDLILTGYPVILNGSEDFSITENPETTVRAGGETHFTIAFSSDKTGQRAAAVMITSNDRIYSRFSFTIAAINSPGSSYTVTPDISLYFSGPVYDSAMEESLINMIDKQSPDHTLDICVYGLDREEVILAIENAIARGVHVRFIGDLEGDDIISSGSGEYYKGYARIAASLDAYFPEYGKMRVNFPYDSGFNDFILINNNGIMHNKFAIFTDMEGREYIFTGSANYTDTCFYMNNNNSLLIADENIAHTYREQFEYLLGLPGTEPVSEVRHHNIDGIIFDVIFAPEISEGMTPIEHLIEYVNTAETAINFMIFSFTHEDLINSIIRRNDSGLEVKGIFDESQLISSSEELLVNHGIPCRIDGNLMEEDDHGGKLHHKTMILDHDTDNGIVITGSFNWSNNANQNNDENILIIHSKEISGIYYNEWLCRWDEGTDIKYSLPDFRYESAAYQEIIISEVMWMGSRKTSTQAAGTDEFIELRNLTDRKISLNGWTIDSASTGGKPLTLKDCSIESFSYLVILNNNLTESAFKPELYCSDSGLSVPNSSIKLVLKDYKGTVIDCAGNGSAGEDFAGYNGSGDGSLKKSMARNEIPGDGTDAVSWFTTETQMNISSSYDYLKYNNATPGADNLAGDGNYQSLDIIISEIAWAGTEISYNDEWLELYNNTPADINLAGWSIGGSLDIQLSGIIPSGKHFLLERTDDNSIPEKAADLIYTGSLNNEGCSVILIYNNREIDNIDMTSGWASGSGSPRISMERINFNAPADNINWQNGPGDTEGAENSQE